MVFSSVTFLFYFLPLFLLVFYATRCSKWALAAFSIVFYAWGEPIFVVLLFASIAYLPALLMLLMVQKPEVP